MQAAKNIQVRLTDWIQILLHFYVSLEVIIQLSNNSKIKNASLHYFKTAKHICSNDCVNSLRLKDTFELDPSQELPSVDMDLTYPACTKLHKLLFIC